ncbi:MAG: cupin domain-containing protein [Deltaproteobacteria bacterium]|nr:cupin domain-containing protein [Deltaproteobacteria bacterium]
MAQVQFIDLEREMRADAQGFSIFPLSGRVRQPAALAQSFHLVSILPGQSRGHHLHPVHEEWLYPFHGAGVFLWEATAGRVQERAITGNRTMIQIPPGIAHAMKNPGPGVLYLMVWREPLGRPGGEPETVSRQI